MKKIIIVMLLTLVMLIGCSKVETYENGVPTYFLEPDGYIIAYVKLNDSNFWQTHFMYGYILEEDYQSYLDGKLDGILIIKNPYENNREISTPFREIMSIEIGRYEDYRKYQ